MFVASVPAEAGELIGLDALEHLPVCACDLRGELLRRDGQHLEEGWFAAPAAAHRPREAVERRGETVRDAGISRNE